MLSGGWRFSCAPRFHLGVVKNMNWNNLETANGNATMIPALLSQLNVFPDEALYEDDPWYSLWGNLYYEGTLYSAAFAAVPEIVKTAASAPEKATLSFFLLPIAVEIARKKEEVVIAPELLPAYQQAIFQLADVATRCIAANKNPEIARAAAAAFALAAGLPQYAELLLEVKSEHVEEILEWCLEE